MTQICVKQETLHCTSGSSDKLYVIQLIQEPDGTFSCTGYNGRRGAALTVQPKMSHGSYSVALSAYNKLAKDKGKTYTTPYTQPVGTPVVGMPSSAPVYHGGAVPPATAPSPAPAAVAPAPTGRQGPLPLLAKPITRADAENYIRNGNYGTQKKYDGDRFVLHLQRGLIYATKRDGTERPIPTGVMTLADDIVNTLPDFDNARATVLDCELLKGDRIAVFDMIRYRDEDFKPVAFVERYFQLEDLLRGISSPAFEIATVAWTEAEKRAMVAQAEAEDWEGVMYRDINAGYEEDVRDDRLLKCKFWATATCTVLSLNMKRSVKLGIAEADGSISEIGDMTIPVDMEIPAKGSLVEVRYLYCYPGGKLVQSTYLRPRTDISVIDQRDQLRPPPPEKLAA